MMIYRGVCKFLDDIALVEKLEMWLMNKWSCRGKYFGLEVYAKSEQNGVYWVEF